MRPRPRYESGESGDEVLGLEQTDLCLDISLALGASLRRAA